MNLFAQIVINSAVVEFVDFSDRLKPYFNVFGLPYQIVDRAFERINKCCLEAPLIILAHGNLQANGEQCFWSEELSYLHDAAASGVGIVSFDLDSLSALKLGELDFSREKQVVDKLVFSAFPHFITMTHEPDEIIVLPSELNPEAAVSVRPVRLNEDMQILLTAGEDPYLAYLCKGKTRIVQWLGNEWMDPCVLGPMRGMDDLLWRSLVWAAKKPFLLREIPPFATMRVDDCVGDHGQYKELPFFWVELANRYGFKPWLGFFHETISEKAVSKLKQLLEEGKATAQFHGVYLFGTVYKTSDSSTEGIQRLIDAWKTKHQWTLPLSLYFIPHNYDLSDQSFAVLERLGVQAIGLPYPVNSGGGAVSHTTPWISAGPYRLNESGTDGVPWSGKRMNVPIYYADWLGQEGTPCSFFNLLTEIRDVNGYEWFNYSDGKEQYTNVEAAVHRGAAILKRCFDSKIPGNLFTHEDSWRGKFLANITPEHWEAMISGIVSAIADYSPRFITMDESVLYVRSLHMSSLKKAVLHSDGKLVLSFEGSTDVPTDIALYTEKSGTIIREWITIPSFAKHLNYVYDTEHTSTVF